jgi:hypothetical protein
MKDLSFRFKKEFKAKLSIALGGKQEYYSTEVSKIIESIVRHNAEVLEKPITDLEVAESVKKYTPIISQIIEAKVQELISTEPLLKVNQDISVRDKLLNDQVEMSAIADIISIKDDGNPDIYEVTVSSSSYEN